MRFLICGLLTFFVCSAHAEEKFSTLTVGNRTYTNVTITSVTATQIYFMHSRGIANAQLNDLTVDLQQHFHYNVRPSVKLASVTVPTATSSAEVQPPAKIVEPKPTEHQPDDRFRELNAKFVADPKALAKSSEPGARKDDVKVDTLHAKSFLHKVAPPLIVSKWLNGIPETKGKFILIDFWATWCPPCRASIPKLNALHAKFKDKVIVMGLSDESEEDVHKLKSPKIEYWEAIDPERRTSTFAQVRGIPHAILIDPDGIVRFEGMPFYLDEKGLARLIARYGN